MASVPPYSGMPSDGNSGDGDDEERTYREYKLEKNPRAHDPDDAGPRDPAAEMREEAGIGTGFEALEGDGDVEKSMQETLDDALEDADFVGVEPVVKGEDGEKVRLSLTQADIEEAQQSPEDRREALLRGIRAELHALNRQAEFDGSGDGSGAGTAVSKQGENAVELLEHIEDELERQDEEEGEPTEGPTGLTEEQAQAVETALNLYVETEEENSVDDPLADVVAWMRSQASDLENNQARGQVFAALASVQNTEMEQSETLV